MRALLLVKPSLFYLDKARALRYAVLCIKQIKKNLVP